MDWNGWELWNGKNYLFYYKSIQDCRSYDLKNIGLKIHNFSLELKQSKTQPVASPVASCSIISTLVRRYVFFNPRCCKSWDCPNSIWTSKWFWPHCVPLSKPMHLIFNRVKTQPEKNVLRKKVFKQKKNMWN